MRIVQITSIPETKNKWAPLSNPLSQRFEVRTGRTSRRDLSGAPGKYRLVDRSPSKQFVNRVQAPVARRAHSLVKIDQTFERTLIYRVNVDGEVVQKLHIARENDARMP